MPASFLNSNYGGDGSVFLIRLLQLRMVHSNQAVRRPAANAAYHTLAGWGEGREEEKEWEGSGERDGRTKREGEKNKAKAGTEGRKEEGQKERRSSSSAPEKKRYNFLVTTGKHFLVGGEEAEKSEVLG